MYFRRNATKDFELRGQTIKAGDKISLWYISGQPRRGHLGRPVHVRHHPRSEPAHRLRRGRAALLPRCAARAHGDPRAVRGAGPSGCRTSSSSARRSPCARTSSAGSSTCRCASKRPLRRLTSACSTRSIATGRPAGSLATMSSLIVGSKGSSVSAGRRWSRSTTSAICSIASDPRRSDSLGLLPGRSSGPRESSETTSTGQWNSLAMIFSARVTSVIATSQDSAFARPRTSCSRSTTKRPRPLCCALTWSTFS